MPPLTVRVLPIGKLKPARYNPRKTLAPSSPAYRKLRASIERFGLVEPLVWNARSGHVVGGHARLRILRDLGFNEIPVSVVRLNPAREKALNIVLNNQEAQGRYDSGKLAAVLRQLKDLPELDATGFTPATLRSLEYTPAEPPDAEPESDCVEITLLVPAEQRPAVEAKLDRLVREYDLVSHVKERRKVVKKATTAMQRTQSFTEKKLSRNAGV